MRDEAEGDGLENKILVRQAHVVESVAVGPTVFAEGQLRYRL